MHFKWTYTPTSESEEDAAQTLAHKLNIAPVLARLLLRRGITTESAAKRFFRPQLTDLINPFLMKDMDLAVDLPQEEEFALSNMMPYTYYNFWFYPKHQLEYCDKYMLFEGIDPAELKVWEETFTKLIKIS